MDPELIGVLDFVGKILPIVAVITAVTVGGWILNNWLRIKHGYPLDGAWGQALHPHTDKEAMERIGLDRWNAQPAELARSGPAGND
jgi:hypothetical protein